MATKKLLFIDPHKDWLKLVKSTLKPPEYDAMISPTLDFLLKIDANEHFDLVFIGLQLAKQNIKTISGLALSYTWRFVVLFPGFPDQKTARIMFKSGIRDISSKPYDAESIKKMVEEEIAYVKKKNHIRNREIDFNTRLNRLSEIIYTPSPARSHKQ